MTTIFPSDGSDLGQ